MGTRQQITLGQGQRPSRQSRTQQEQQQNGINVWVKILVLAIICFLIPITYLFGKKLESTLEDYLGVLNQIRQKNSTSQQDQWADLSEFMLWDSLRSSNFTEFFDNELVIQDIDQLQNIVDNLKVSQYSQKSLHVQQNLEQYLQQVQNLARKQDYLNNLKKNLTVQYNEYNTCIGETRKKFKQIDEEEKAVDQDQLRIQQEINELKEDLSKLRKLLLEAQRKFNINKLNIGQNEQDLQVLIEKRGLSQQAQKEYDGEEPIYQKQLAQGNIQIDILQQNIYQLKQDEIQDIYKLNQLLEQGVPVKYTIEELKEQYFQKINAEQGQISYLQVQIDSFGQKLSELFKIAQQFSHLNGQVNALQQDNEQRIQDNEILQEEIRRLNEEIIQKQELLKIKLSQIKIKSSDEFVQNLNQEIKQCYNKRIDAQLLYQKYQQVKLSQQEQQKTIKNQKLVVQQQIQIISDEYKKEEPVEDQNKDGDQQNLQQQQHQEEEELQGQEIQQQEQIETESVEIQQDKIDL